MQAVNDLRQIMRRWTSGVVIATTIGSDLSRYGITVSSFTSVSVDPPLVTLTITRPSHMHSLVLESGLIGISILGQAQQAISDRFAGRFPHDEDRFAGLNPFTLLSGVPLIPGSLAYLDCTVVHQYDMPTSTLFIAGVNAMANESEEEPLVYLNRDYHRICDGNSTIN